MEENENKYKGHVKTVFWLIAMPFAILILAIVAAIETIRYEVWKLMSQPCLSCEFKL